MPLPNRIYRFTDMGEAFKGVPVMIADSLPDKFGNAVINQWLAKLRKIETDFYVIDRLCYTGAKAIIAWNEKTNEIKSGQIDAGSDFDYWLMKFDGVGKNGDHGLEDEPEYTLIEYAYYEMAKKAGVVMNECRIFSENNRNHFMTKHFDRVDEKNYICRHW